MISFWGADAGEIIYVVVVIIAFFSMIRLYRRAPKIEKKLYSPLETTYIWLVFIAVLYAILGGLGGISTRVAGILGLFTPLGPWTIRIPWVLAIVLLGIVAAERLSMKRNFSNAQKIAFTLCFLFCFTFVCDFAFVPFGSYITFMAETFTGQPFTPSSFNGEF